MLDVCGARVYYIIGLLVYTPAPRCQCFHDNSDWILLAAQSVVQLGENRKMSSCQAVKTNLE